MDGDVTDDGDVTGGFVAGVSWIGEEDGDGDTKLWN